MHEAFLPACDCPMKSDLRASTDKLLFIREYWSEFDEPKKIPNMSPRDLQCFCCIMNSVLTDLIQDMPVCHRKEFIHLTQVYREILLTLKP